MLKEGREGRNPMSKNETWNNNNNRKKRDCKGERMKREKVKERMQ